MDVLSALDLGTRLPLRQLKRACQLAGAALIAGWAFDLPVVHPFVESILDERARQLTEAVMSAIS